MPESDTTATQDAPAAPAPEQTDPSPSGPDQSAEASQSTVADTAQDEVDWRARHDALEKERIPTLMSERDRSANEAKQYRERAQTIAQEFEGWIEFGAQRGMTAAQLLDRIQGSKAQVENRQRDTQAQQAETVGTINSLYRSGEGELAKFIEGLREAEPTLRITADSVARYRKAFDSIAPKSTSAATATAVTSPVKTPPKVPTPAGSPNTPEAAWKGPKMKSKDLLARAFGNR